MDDSVWWEDGLQRERLGQYGDEVVAASLCVERGRNMSYSQSISIGLEHRPAAAGRDVSGDGAVVGANCG